MARYYPVMLDVQNRPAIVIGDGALARQKVEALRDAGAHVQHYVDWPPAEAVRDAFVVVAVTNDVSRIDWLRSVVQPHQLLNVMDRPQDCTFVFASILRRGPLTVAVSTEGTAPALARLVREKLETVLGPEWEDFLRLAGNARRRLQEVHTAFSDRVAFFEALMASDVLPLLQAGQPGQAEAHTYELVKRYEASSV